MAYRIIITQDIKKQIADLPGHIKAIARQQIARLASEPRPPRSKELEGHLGHYRLHLSNDYRLVWLVSDEDQFVEIEYVGFKIPDLYSQLGLGRPEDN